MENCTTVNGLVSFSIQFKPVHRYLSLIICAVGLVINTITLTILTRRSMRHGNNLFLLTICICDFIILSTTPPRTIYFRFYEPAIATVYWQYYRLYQASTAVTARTASLYLAAAMAVYRFHILRKKYNYNSLSHDVTVHKIIATILTIVILCNIPNFTAFVIIKDSKENQSVYKTIPVHEDYISSLFWINGIVFKCIPCLILVVFGCGIVNMLKRAQQRQTTFSKQHRTNKLNRTTRLLVCIILITLTCELPHAFLSIIAGLGHCPAMIYQHLGDVLDILALLNFTIAFTCQLAMNGEVIVVMRKALRMPSSVRGTTVLLNGGELKPRRKYSLQYSPVKKETFRLVYTMTSFPLQIKSLSLHAVEIRTELRKPRLISVVQENGHMLKRQPLST